MSLVSEIDFCDPKIKGKLPIVVYSSISKKPNGELIYLINIEPINNAKVMYIEVFSNNNFYIKGKIKSFYNNLNIYSFRCNKNQRYFIKISTEEFGDNSDYDEIIVNKVNDHNKIDLLFFGFYQFENNILINEDTIINNNENKKKNNIELNVISKNENLKTDVTSFMNGFILKKNTPEDLQDGE
mgnify:CR=1 FL=1|tara:strand:+ start:3548 stop:4099 length:552 start_codon:yes stop_codon:yes gene_type:complete